MAVIEVKSPRMESLVSDVYLKKDPSGFHQLAEQMLKIRDGWGLLHVLGMITTFNETVICWFPESDDNMKSRDPANFPIDSVTWAPHPGDLSAIHGLFAGKVPHIAATVTDIDIDDENSDQGSGDEENGAGKERAVTVNNATILTVTLHRSRGFSCSEIAWLARTAGSAKASGQYRVLKFTTDKNAKHELAMWQKACDDLDIRPFIEFRAFFQAHASSVVRSGAAPPTSTQASKGDRDLRMMRRDAARTAAVEVVTEAEAAAVAEAAVEAGAPNGEAVVETPVVTDATAADVPASGDDQGTSTVTTRKYALVLPLLYMVPKDERDKYRGLVDAALDRMARSCVQHRDVHWRHVGLYRGSSGVCAVLIDHAASVVNSDSEESLRTMQLDLRTCDESGCCQ
eukprot:m.144674 g.144674  ORF g.144674 m.144674 type:complete len:399 (+) comp9675_c0_seq12:1052-2248(+)